jgi:hypothetical protein
MAKDVLQQTGWVLCAAIRWGGLVRAAGGSKTARRDRSLAGLL